MLTPDDIRHSIHGLQTIGYSNFECSKIEYFGVRIFNRHSSSRRLLVLARLASQRKHVGPTISGRKSMAFSRVSVLLVGCRTSSIRVSRVLSDIQSQCSHSQPTDSRITLTLDFFDHWQHSHFSFVFIVLFSAAFETWVFEIWDSISPLSRSLAVSLREPSSCWTLWLGGRAFHVSYNRTPRPENGFRVFHFISSVFCITFHSFRVALISCVGGTGTLQLIRDAGPDARRHVWMENDGNVSFSFNMQSSIL